MNKCILGLITTLTLIGCQSTPVKEYDKVQLIDAELLSEKWQGLERFPPPYPIENARAGKEGCASVEYVITPSNEIENIKVISSTNKHFAKQAKLNVKDWKWSQLASNILQKPIKTTTQFQFCLETGDGHCSDKSSFRNSQCTGEDVIYSIAYKIKRPVK